MKSTVHGSYNSHLKLVPAGRKRKLFFLKTFARASSCIYIIILCVILPGLSHYVFAGNDHSFATGISGDSNSLNIKVVDVPLITMLQDISKKTGIKVYGDSSLSNERITAEFYNLTTEELLKKILSRFNFAFVFSSNDNDNGVGPISTRIKEAWIFSSDKKGIPFKEINDPVKSDPITLSDEIKETNNFNLADKLRQLESMGEDVDPIYIPILLNLLKDTDQSVRLAAMDTLSNFGTLIPVDQIVKIAFDHSDPQMRLAVLGMGLDIPYETVVQHALHVPFPQVRIESLQILSGSENIEGVARHAINDPDPSVQDIAREILRGTSEEYSDIPPEEDESIQISDGAEEE